MTNDDRVALLDWFVARPRSLAELAVFSCALLLERDGQVKTTLAAIEHYTSLTIHRVPRALRGIHASGVAHITVRAQSVSIDFNHEPTTDPALVDLAKGISYAYGNAAQEAGHIAPGAGWRSAFPLLQHCIDRVGDPAVPWLPAGSTPEHVAAWVSDMIAWTVGDYAKARKRIPLLSQLCTPGTDAAFQRFWNQVQMRYSSDETPTVTLSDDGDWT